MKQILAALLLVFSLSFSASAQSAPKALSLTWTNNDAAYGPACPGTTAAPICLGPIEAEDITALTPTILSTAIAYNATSYVFTFPTAPTYGNHTYAVFATGVSATGAAVQSGTATVVVDVEPVLNQPVITSATAK
jgi:hypothetical protein